MSRWERPPYGGALKDDQNLEEIPTVLMARAGSEVMFDDLRERYQRSLEGPESTSPSVTSEDAFGENFGEDGGFELLEHPTGDIDPLSDYLEMHALQTGAHRPVERSDPRPSWDQPTHRPGVTSYYDEVAYDDSPPPREFVRDPSSAPGGRAPVGIPSSTPRPAPASTAPPRGWVSPPPSEPSFPPPPPSSRNLSPRTSQTLPRRPLETNP